MTARMGIAWVVGLLALGGAAGWAQEASGKPDPAQAQKEMEQGMQAMMKLAQPGEHHEHLAQLVGEWSYTAKMWYPGNPQAMELSGTMRGEGQLGGRFVEMVWTGDFMGQPFEGIGIDGYDKSRNEYTSTWRDNFGTYTLHYSGQCDRGGKLRTMTGSYADPMTGDKVRDKGKTTFRDDGTVLMESWRVLPDGKEMKTMEILLRRD